MKLTISFRKDGPLILNVQPKDITFDNIVFDENKHSIPLKKSLFFCRCGQSKRQPYCDGMHKKVGFSDERKSKKELVQHYEGKDITIRFNRSICSGAGACTRKFPNIYDPSKKDWIHPDKGSVEEAIQSVKNCPSGALSYTLNDKFLFNENKKSKVWIKKRGALYVQGQITLEDTTFHTVSNPKQFGLCRCGASKNKPFCDYSHKTLKGEQYTF